MTFSWSERQFIADMATAVKWRIEQMVEAGASLEQAKRDAIKQAEPSWRGLTPEIRQAVKNVCWSISGADLSKRTHRAVKDRARRDMEKLKGKPLGLVDRFLWRCFGVVWRV